MTGYHTLTQIIRIWGTTANYPLRTNTGEPVWLESISAHAAVVATLWQFFRHLGLPFILTLAAYLLATVRTVELTTPEHFRCTPEARSRNM